MTPLDKGGLNRDLIEKLSMDNTIVRMAFMYYLKGQLTWEQSLIAMVSWLNQCNVELLKAQEEYLSKRSPSLVFQLSDEELRGVLDIVGNKLVK